ncbi:MAG: DUF3237 domain-containing protein [Rhizobiaceae bacterium]|nr:DUF3237 domain-containing protein [Rhizobiaceae bacterium]
MPISMTEFETAGSAFLEVRTKPLFIMKLEARPAVPAGETPNGPRRVRVIYGGRFEGERLSGRVLDGGSDWQIVRPDGYTVLDVRLTIETDDGAMIYMTYGGLRHGPADVMARIEKGEVVDPASYYFRINPMFETASAKYDWLNGILGIGIGHRFEQGLVYNVFEVL